MDVAVVVMAVVMAMVVMAVPNAKNIDKNGNGFEDEIKAKEKNLGLDNHETVKSC
jgi:hypothetical protein